MRRYYHFVAGAALLFCTQSFAQQSELKSALDRVVKEGQGTEMALRMIRMGLEMTPGKLQKEGQGRFVCSLTTRTGSHVKRLRCNENEVLNYLRDAGALEDGGDASPIFPLRKEGAEYLSEKPLTEGELNGILGRTGPAPLNRELVAAVIQGGSLPDGMPSTVEVGDFAEALAGVKQVRKNYDPRIESASGEEKRKLIRESDAAMMERIRQAGLSIQRYNEISQLVDEYGSLRQAVADRMPSGT